MLEPRRRAQSLLRAGCEGKPRDGPARFPGPLRRARRRENSLEGLTEKQKDGEFLGALAPPLTDRVAEVLSLLDRGLSAKQIKNELNLSETTVRYHLRELRRVLGASSIPEALHKARKLGLLPR
jgi:ATP/maltotriose-dependent transcriptional regulator MalT